MHRVVRMCAEFFRAWDCSSIETMVFTLYFHFDGEFLL